MASTVLPPLPPIAFGAVYTASTRLHNFRINNNNNTITGDYLFRELYYRKIVRKNSETFIQFDPMIMKEKRIVFHLNSHTVTITGTNSRHISMEELNAIIQKSKDLGWL